MNKKKQEKEFKEKKKALNDFWKVKK